jgi:hypothetical protein
MEGRPSRCGYAIVCRDTLDVSPPSLLCPRLHRVRGHRHAHRSFVVARTLLVNLTSKARTSSNVQRVAVRLSGRRGVSKGGEGPTHLQPGWMRHSSGLVLPQRPCCVCPSSVGVHNVATLASRLWSPLPLECGFGTCSQ